MTLAPELVEVVDDFAGLGVRAFTTKRAFGSLGTLSDEPVRDVIGRWDALRRVLRDDHGVSRLATASQVHGAHVLVHEPRWNGWLREVDADGHVAPRRGVAMGVTVADCVPVFIAHPSGAAAVLHSGWRGTAARIVETGIAKMEEHGCRAADLHLHLGPAICGACYEVSSEVATQLLGVPSERRTVDLRALIADHARARGVRRIAISRRCTKCDNEQFFSHRAGDAGRQVAIIVAS